MQNNVKGLALRGSSAGLLVITAVVHLNLYTREHYRTIPTVGWLFLLTTIVAFVLAVALLLRANPIVSASAALFAVGVLGGYLLTLLLPTGLFNFKEPRISYSGAIAIAAEAGVVALALVALLRRAPPVLPAGARRRRMA